MTASLVSVVIPARDRSDLLRRALSSVRSQTYPNIEILVVDDGSTEDLCAVARAFDARCIRLESSLGPSGARNEGISRATGVYLAFLDSDDEWFPQKIERQVALLESNVCDVVYCSAQYVDERGRVVSSMTARHRGAVFPALLFRNVVAGSASAVVLRRECLETVPPFATRWSEDWDLWLRLSTRFRFDYVPETMVRIRVAAESRLNSVAGEAYLNDVRGIYQRLRDDEHVGAYVRRHWRRCRASMAWLAGYFQLMNEGNAAAARRQFLTAIVLWPGEWRAYRSLVRSLVPVALLRGLGLRVRESGR